MANIYFRYGAMGCGKTTALLQVAYSYEEKGMKVVIIKSSLDKKGNKNIVSRLGIEREVDLLVLKNEKILDKIVLDNLDCILVDEVQFLAPSQVRELWIVSKLYDIPVICYGLKTNFKGKLFSGSKAVIEVADKMEELSVVCSCGENATFNARIENGEYINKGNEIAIDTIDASYESLCGKCFIEKVLRIKKNTKK